VGARWVERDEEIVKVLDFGIAKSQDSLAITTVPTTRTGDMLGTPFYMSPEQAYEYITNGYSVTPHIYQETFLDSWGNPSSFDVITYSVN
jgi:serine/threonine protein kinase